MNIKIGVGKFDVTGPCYGVGFVGMSNLAQTGRGIHSRLFSRAFVIEDLSNGKCTAIVVADIGMCFQAVHQAVVRKLKKYPAFVVEGSPLYTEKNVLITATHTHSGPGGYSHYLAYNASMLGFNGQNFDAIVEGIFRSIARAHAQKKEGKILIASGELDDCGKIRSLPAFNNNPEIGSDTSIPPDGKKMILLKFVDRDGHPHGALNWFPMHPTSMGQKNRLISSDNKGYAEELFERKFPGVISAFANSCCGDISPNVEPPDGTRDFENTKIFGEKQFRKAEELFNGAHEEVNGELDYRQTYVDMSQVAISGAKRTWPAAMGLGMSQGSSEDSTGPGPWPEGTTKSNYHGNPDLEIGLLKCITTLLKGIEWESKPDQAYLDGHGEKPILFHLGLSKYKGDPLVPSVVPLQLIKLGSLLIIAHPGEMTTVAGMRMRKKLMEIMDESTTGIKEAVISTYTGAYTSYTTTKEEYDMQHYEGASTLFGPWTLAAHQQENAKLALALRHNEFVPRGPLPASLGHKYRKRPRTKPERKPLGHEFGDLEGHHPEESYARGETVKVRFWGGNPNNHLQTESSYLEVQKKEGNDWKPVFCDRDFCTIFRCHRRVADFIVEIVWNIPEDQEPGEYRLCYFGHWKFDQSRLVEINAASREFSVE